MPTDWEAQYLSGETPWDKGAPSPALEDYLAHTPLRGKVLVPGCGAGHDVRALAAQGAEVVGLDVARTAVTLADSFPKVGGESYVLGDFFDLPPALRGAFDHVWEHTCFCAIDPSMRPAYVEAAARRCGRADSCSRSFTSIPATIIRTKARLSKSPSPSSTASFLPRFIVAEEWLPTRTYPGREGREWMRRMTLRS